MENKKNITIKRVVQRCGCDKALPLAVVYILYVILHGHLSPGGGFQGGILTVAVVLLVYLGHGYVNTKKTFIPDVLGPLEGLVLAGYIVLAVLGIVFGTSFCENFAFQNGAIGKLLSSGTIAWMDEFVAANVVIGSIMLSIGMLSVLFPQDIDNLKEKKKQETDDSLEM